MKFTGNLPKVKLDLAPFKAALHQQAQTQIKQCLTQYIAALLRAIPDWSGASRATLLSLGSENGMNVFAGGRGNGYEYIGDRSADGVATSSNSLNLAGPIYSFTYDTSLPHLAWNNLHNANVDKDRTKWRHVLLKNPGPYNLEARGAIAFLHFDFTLPNATKFITVEKLQVG
jgi:hypothetical protein